MRTRVKPNGKSSQPASKRRRIVRELAALGHSSDVIGAVLGIGRDALRASHALDLHAGRQAKAAEKAATGDLTREEMCCADVVLNSFASDWFDPVCGNLLWYGLDGSCAKTPASAYAAWLRAGGRFITTGIDSNFGPERIAEFVRLKVEAQKLLGAVEKSHGGAAANSNEGAN